MIQIENSIDNKLALPLEDFFCDLETSNWSIMQKTDNDAYKLSGYFEDEEEAIQHWNQLRVVFPEIPETFEIRVIEDQDWKNAYKKYLRPWSYKDLHWIPVWEKENFRIPAGEVAVYFDAGMAFGTGAHETTQLCAQRLIDYRDEHKRSFNSLTVVDAGCGSGILGISAKLLGFGEVMGFDIDDEAVRISEENAEFNKVDKGIIFKTVGLENIFPNQKADFILANILANVLCDSSDILLNAVNKGGTLVLSGILVEELDKVRKHFCERADRFWIKYRVDSRTLGEWVDLRFDRD